MDTRFLWFPLGTSCVLLFIGGVFVPANVVFLIRPSSPFWSVCSLKRPTSFLWFVTWPKNFCTYISPFFSFLHSRKNEASFLLFVGRDLSTAIIEFSSHLLNRSCPFVHLDLFNWHLLSVALPDGFSSTYASFLFIRSFSELVPS